MGIAGAPKTGCRMGSGSKESRASVEETDGWEPGSCLGMLFIISQNALQQILFAIEGHHSGKGLKASVFYSLAIRN